jgi:hypothetical protein
VVPERVDRRDLVPSILGADVAREARYHIQSTLAGRWRWGTRCPLDGDRRFDEPRRPVP